MPVTQLRRRSGCSLKKKEERKLCTYHIHKECSAWMKQALPIIGIAVFIFLILLVIASLSKFPYRFECSSKESYGKKHKQSEFSQNVPHQTILDMRPKVAENENYQLKKQDQFSIENAFSDLDDRKEKVIPVKSSASCTMTDATCSVVCTLQKTLGDMIDEINKISKNCNQISLTIRSSSFPEKLQKGWLDNLSCTVTSLSLELFHLKGLDEGTFSGDIFSTLSHLTIVGSDIKYLEKNVFSDDLPILDLEIRNNQHRAMKFEAGVFENIRTSLETLQLANCLDGSRTLANITGIENSHFSSLLTLDLRSNKIFNLNKDTFNNMNSVQALYMDDCVIESVEKDAFSSFSHLKTLTLSNNELRTLANGTFAHLKNLKTIDLKSNMWVCDCSLSWLQDMYIDNITGQTFSKPLFCGSSEFEIYEFCPKNSTTPTTTISPSTVSTPTLDPITVTTSSISTTTDSSTTPESPQMYFKVKCDDTEILTDFRVDQAETIELRNGLVSFSYYLNENNDNEAPSYSISIQGDQFDTASEFLLIRRIPSRDITCKAIPRESFQITLECEKVYSVCLYQRGKNLVNIYDCTALKTPVKLADQTWLTNESKTKLIVGVSFGMLVVVIVTGLSVFLCIRQHPSLIKGNKRVIMVGSKSADALVMPKEYEYQTYVPQSIKSISDGYLTPTGIHAERYYEAPMSPNVLVTLEKTYRSPKQAAHRKLTRTLSVKSMGRRYSIDHIYEIPPPLPPNHPSEDDGRRRTTFETLRIC